MKKYYIKIIKEANFGFQIGFLFDEFDPFKPTIIIQNFKIDTVLYYFLTTGTSNRTLMGLNQLLKCLGFCLYPPFIFSFTVPLNN